MNGGTLSNNLPSNSSNIYKQYKQRVEQDGGNLLVTENYIRQYYPIISRSKWAFVPSGTKTGKLYTIFPNTSESDIVFSRNSNATSYNHSGKLTEVFNNVPILDWDFITGTFKGLRITRQTTNLFSNSISGDYLRKTNISEIVNIWGFTDIYSNGVYFGDNSLSRYAGKAHTVDNYGNIILSAFIQMDDGSEPKVGHYTDSYSDLGINIGGGNILLRTEARIFKEQITDTIWRIAGRVNYSGYSTNQFLRKAVTNSSKGFKVTGYMLEKGYFYPGCHIPTNSQLKTKLFDQVKSNLTTSLTDIVIFADIKVNYPSENQLSTSDIITLMINENNYISICTDFSGKISMSLVKDNVELLQINSSFSHGKVCAKFSQNNYILIVNGIKFTNFLTGNQSISSFPYQSTKIILGNENCDVYFKAVAVLKNLSFLEMQNLTI